ncbi:uncharacterized protein LOC129589190 [Paramacrobiotus metropolitanus]|uniref:uncharacterized protein LOC129589190 n=1 Tax=Paramacrobiotus metropolitanus TaxID=2943436 RepID=UPI0024459C11|nr:uncharacterized protein LOC129589190 [Paramacrobiotus metropolitanus]
MAMTFVADNSGIVVADKLGDAYYYPFDQDVAKHQTPILGHISVLTDVVVTRDKRFILTADRDEKIRVSHFPLADDIQAFCLGHTEFVSKITVPWQDRPIVISGSGDRSVRAFNFLTGADLGNISLLEDSDTTPTYVTSLEYSNDHEVFFVSFFGMNRIFGIRVDIDTEASSVAFRKAVDIPITHGNNPLPIRSLCIVGTILVVICNDAEIPLRIYPDVFALISSNQESGDDLKSACTGVTEELKSLIRTAGDEKRLDSVFFDSLGQFFNEAQAEPFVDGDDVSSKKLRTTESV